MSSTLSFKLSSKPAKLYHSGKHFRSTALVLKDGRCMELRRNDKTRWGPGEERTFWPSKEAWNAYVLATDVAATAPILVVREIPTSKAIKTDRDHVQTIRNYLDCIDKTNGTYNKEAIVIELLDYLSNEASQFMKNHKEFADTVARKCYELKVYQPNSEKIKEKSDCILKNLNKSLFEAPCKAVHDRCGEYKHCDILNNDTSTEFAKSALNNTHYPCKKQDSSNQDVATAANAVATKVESSIKEVQSIEKIENISRLRSYLQTIDSSPSLLAENLCKELVLYLSKPANLHILHKFHCFRMEVRARVHIYLKTELGNKFLSDTDF
jgi:hypothetical protein